MDATVPRKLLLCPPAPPAQTHTLRPQCGSVERWGPFRGDSVIRMEPHDGMSLLTRAGRGPTLSPSLHREGRSGAVAACRQGESPRQDPARPAPRPRTSSPQEPGRELCRLSQPAVVFSLQQRALPKTTLSSKAGQVWPVGCGFLTPDLGGLDISLPSSKSLFFSMSLENYFMSAGPRFCVYKIETAVLIFMQWL